MCRKLAWKLGGNFSNGAISILKFISIDRGHILREMFTLLMSPVHIILNSNLSFRKYRSLGELVAIPDSKIFIYNSYFYI